MLIKITVKLTYSFTEDNEMDMFERNKGNSIYTQYLENCSDKIWGNSSKFIPEIGKIHLPISGNSGLDIHNFLHESIHYLFSKSALFQQIQDLMYAHDVIDSFMVDLNELSYSAKNDHIDFALDLLSEDKEIRCKRYDELCYVYYWLFELNKRGKTLQNNAIVSNEGTATYCALHIQDFEQNSVPGFLYNNFVTSKFKNEFYKVQKELIEKLNKMPEEHFYKKGYKLAERIAQIHGPESVLIVNMLANNVPFYNYDLLHDSEIFYERAEYLFNADERFEFFISLNNRKQKQLIRCANNQKHMKKVLEVLEQQKRRKRTHEFRNIEMYYRYYLLLHNKLIQAVNYILDEDVRTEIVGYVRSRVFPSVTSADDYFYNMCSKEGQVHILKNDKEYIDFAEKFFEVTANFNMEKLEYVTQITEEDVKAMIMRESSYETFIQIMGRSESNADFC